MNFKWWFPFVPDLRPKYILFYVGLNDFHKEAGCNYDRLVGANQGFNLKREFSEKSAMWHMFRTLRGVYEAVVVKKIGHRSLDFSEVHWTREAIQDDYRFMETRLDEYADRLRLLADMTRELGGEPIFVSQPSRKYRATPDGLVGDSSVSDYDKHQYNGVDYHNMMSKLDITTQDVAMEKGVLFIDLASHTGWADTDFYDFAHMTPQGAEKVGILLHYALRSTMQGAEQSAPAASQGS